MLIGAFTWTEFAQQLAAGIREGAIYAGLALAIVIIYRTTRVINFAQGEMATFTTFISWSLMNHGLSFWTAFPIVLAIAFTGGVAIERIVIRPVEDAPVLTIVIVTLGLALLLNGLMSVIWGGANRQFRGPFSTRTIDLAGVPISVQDIGIVRYRSGSSFCWRCSSASRSSVWHCVRLPSTPIRRGSSAFASAGCSHSAGGSPRCSARLRG